VCGGNVGITAVSEINELSAGVSFICEDQISPPLTATVDQVVTLV
jgi:hypothetical protein